MTFRNGQTLGFQVRKHIHKTAMLFLGKAVVEGVFYIGKVGRCPSNLYTPIRRSKAGDLYDTGPIGSLTMGSRFHLDMNDGVFLLLVECGR